MPEPGGRKHAIVGGGLRTIRCSTHVPGMTQYGSMGGGGASDDTREKRSHSFYTQWAAAVGNMY